MLPERDWNTDGYLRDAGFVPALGREVAGWLSAKPGERILDVGCGDGALTLELARTGARVTGIDASPAQIAVAQAAGLDAHVMDAADLNFEDEFDAVFSNAALHWMLDIDAVIAGVYRALKSGGRFVAEMGGAGNVAHVCRAIFAALEARGIDGRPALPWVFPTPEDYGAALDKAGFRVQRMDYFPRPTVIDCSMTDWLDIFAPAFAALVDTGERRALFEDIARRLEPHLFDTARGGWWVDYVRLRFEAVKP